METAWKIESGGCLVGGGQAPEPWNLVEGDKKNQFWGCFVGGGGGPRTMDLVGRREQN